MTALPPAKVGPHYRAPWRRHDPEGIFVHGSLDDLCGHPRYQKAKSEFDMPGAAALVAAMWRDEVIDRIADAMLAADLPCRILSPHPEFDAGDGPARAGDPIRNAIPIAYDAQLADNLGCAIDDEIYLAARPGRTKLKTIQRFLWQPRFSGPVHTDCAYILTDDVCSMCGTFAALRSYIVEHGGRVVAVTCLAHGKGNHVKFPIGQATLGMIRKYYGPDIDGFWKQEIGHEIDALTEAEGLRLVHWFDKNCARGGSASALHRLGDELAQAAENRGDYAGA